MRKHIAKFGDWYFKNENHITSLGIVGGFLFDIFTLTRIDHTFENIWIGAHLVGCLL